MSKRVIYILGAGRSGTTLLDIMLGNASGIFSGGELVRFPRLKGCVSGLDDQPHRTLFWNNFVEKISPSLDFDRLNLLHRKIEYHSGCLKFLLGFEQRRSRHEFQQYTNLFFATLFSSIREDIVVDSSKYPGRALALSGMLNCNISYIYIRRDPAEVVRSFAKTNVYIPPKNWLSANLYYLTINTLSILALRRLRKKHVVIEIKYEDLIGNPVWVLETIENIMSLDLSRVIEKVKHQNELEVGNLFAGNSLRIQSHIKLLQNKSTRSPNLKDFASRLINRALYP